jgi:hypothetical protein
MPTNPTAKSRWTTFTAYLLPLLIYFAIVVPLGLRQRELMNGDAINYLRRAQYLLHGQFYYFISEHWSLMLSWLIAPLIAAHIDGLYAARIVLGSVGAVYMICFLSLTQRLLKVHWIWHCLAGLVLAPLVAAQAMRAITPDLLLATWLVIYFLIVLHPDLLKSRRRQFAAGIVGGFAYLAKSFALPFVLAHLLMTLLVKSTQSRKQEPLAPPASPLRNLSSAYARGLLGFLLIAGPWIGALSWKYHHLTFGSAGAAAHGMIGPEDVAGFKRQGVAMRANFAIPPGPFLTPFENPEKLYPRWSPFTSKDNFLWQVSIIQQHAVELIRFLAEIAPPYLVPPLIVLSTALLRFRSAQRWKIAWLLLTLLLFLGPFLVVYITSRYLMPHIVPLALLLAFVVVLEWRPATLTAPTSKIPLLHWVRPALALLISGSFLWGSYEWMKPILSSHGSNVYRLLGRKIKNDGLAGAFACEDKARASEVAYHSGLKYAGFPDTPNPDEATRRIHQAGVNYLMIFDTRRLNRAATCAPQMIERGGWRQAMRYRGITLYQFDPTAPATSRPTTREVMPAAEDAFEDMDDEADQKPPPQRHAPAKNKKTMPRIVLSRPAAVCEISACHE